MLEARGGRRPAGSPVIGPIAAIRSKQTMRGSNVSAVAIIGWAGGTGAVVATADGKVETIPVSELTIWDGRILAAVAQARARLDRDAGE